MSISNFEDLPLFEVVPESGSATKGVILLNEWWGLVQQTKDNASQLSKSLNAIAVAPDFYRGKVGVTPDEASHLMNGLNWDQAMQDIRTAVKYLKSKGILKVGVVGWCMGGALSIAAAVHVPELSACVAFYGIPKKAFADPSTAVVPIQCHFGEKDQSKGFSDKESAIKLKNALKLAAGQNVDRDFHFYEEADHAFMTSQKPMAYEYNEKAAKLAYQRTVDFILEKLA